MPLIEIGAVTVAAMFAMLIAKAAVEDAGKFVRRAWLVFVLLEIGAERAVLALAGVV